MQVRSRWQALLDRTAIAADASLHDSGRYDPGRRRRRQWLAAQENGGLGDGLVRPRAGPVIYIYVNDYQEAIYFIRGTDAKGALLEGRTLHDDVPEGRAAALDRKRGGFWSLTMYDKDYFMLPDCRTGARISARSASMRTS